MSFARYLKEQRADFIDFRADHQPAPGPGIALELDDARGTPGRGSVIGGGAGGRMRRKGARGDDPPAVRYRHVTPAFAPSPFAPPLPYVEPWERR